MKIPDSQRDKLMRKSVVAIVGRPNVGKSTLFNRMLKKRRAVVDDLPGVTRDRLYGEAEWEDRAYIVVDTGGFVGESDDPFSEEIRKQVMYAVEEADIIVFVMDAEEGLMPADVELTDMLRKRHKDVFYIVNKIDGPKKEKTLLSDFYALGVDIMPVSAANGYGYDVLMAGLVSKIPMVEKAEESHPRISIIGRPNVGKSTLVNALLSKDRMIVSPVAGTTRDAVDSVCTYYGKKYVLVDTAGIRRKGRMAGTIEHYSFLRTIRNVEDADVAVIVMDASEGIVELDQKIAGIADELRKPAVILVNKWDLIDKDEKSVRRFQEQVDDKLWFIKHAPMITISALNKKRVTRLFPVVDDLIERNSKRIGTHELNEFLRRTVSAQEPPIFRGRRVKIFYMTQVRTNPPGFVLFTNRKEGVKRQYLRYIERRLREEYSFDGIPLDLFVRQRKQQSPSRAAKQYNKGS
jgi:GTP-binding protein